MPPPFLHMTMNWQLRSAEESDVPQLELLIPLSARKLQAANYSTAQIEAALGPVFAVDTQLIRDRTYFVVEEGKTIIACGGWSKRRSCYGGDQGRSAPDPELNPAVDAARIRAFFVHPIWARRGIASCIMAACEDAIRAAGFRRAEIVATLTGEPFYRTFGYTVIESYNVTMAQGLALPVVRLARHLDTPPL